MFNVPVVIIIFNRPDITRELLSCLKKIKPRNMFIVSDAARYHVEDEDLKVQETRQIAENIEWECKVRKNYADENMGCMRRVSTGLDWVFENVDRAIILEDDCIPSGDFFTFCEDILERYAEDERVMSISGTRLSPVMNSQDTSYTFSKYSICWGWATWKRAWNLYDGELTKYKSVKNSKYLKQYLGGTRPGIYWGYILDRVYKGDINSWAYRWMFSHWVNNGLSVVCSRNLVTNIGCGNDATHTKDDNMFLARKSCHLDKPFKYLETVMCDYNMDEWIEDNFYSKSLIGRAKWMINKILK